MAGRSSHGSTFSFAGVAFTVTSINVNYGSERAVVAAPHMGLGPNDFETVYTLHRTRDERPVVDVEYLSLTVPAVNAFGSVTIAISGGPSISGTATCISSQVVASVGDLVRGTASFRVEVP